MVGILKAWFKSISAGKSRQSESHYFVADLAFFLSGSLVGFSLFLGFCILYGCLGVALVFMYPAWYPAGLSAGVRSPPLRQCFPPPLSALSPAPVGGMGADLWTFPVSGLLSHSSLPCGFPVL